MTVEKKGGPVTVPLLRLVAAVKAYCGALLRLVAAARKRRLCCETPVRAILGWDGKRCGGGGGGAAAAAAVAAGEPRLCWLIAAYCGLLRLIVGGAMRV